MKRCSGRRSGSRKIINFLLTPHNYQCNERPAHKLWCNAGSLHCFLCRRGDLQEGENEFLFLPVALGYWKQHELWDGTYTLDDLLDIAELAEVRRENEKRAAEAARG